MLTRTIRQSSAVLRRMGRCLTGQFGQFSRAAPQRALRGMYALGLYALVSPPLQGVLPNPFCNVFNIIKDWLGGIIVVSVAMVAVALLLRQFAAERFGHSVTNGIFSIAGGLFILGLLLTNNGAGIEAIAQALGLDLTISCP